MVRMRTYDAYLVDRVIKDHTTIEVDPIDWVADQENVALTNDFGDVALFEHRQTGLVDGHYHFNSRGRQAIEAGRIFLDEVFSECYNILVIRGFTPLTNLGARWMSRKLGFKSHGVLKIGPETFELFILSKKEFMNE